ncbi:winged helix-turn-helix domain-containing protein [Porphyrobacter sp. ULC335]|uniref:winged helix-turn-helix domain-containing protein n=1 Tax=Porphyrobacter sp. ULC335 TaxID=2854260 RepID=UPI002220294B|nr:winged helix-turn-helix domain-containing protein [Porphyrobacter sp. ULC335]UYV15105.1 winged helix-turn-helix domain-containing protein [Porphyrobacter sp. ULC335]
MAYLILEQARIPLAPREIIRRAYLQEIIPPHLHGKTQHKTLTARLSVNILEHRENSEFFRPWPGRFFLSKYIEDESIPQEYRTPIVAKRRARQLKKEYSAYLPKKIVDSHTAQRLDRRIFAELIRSGTMRYSSIGSIPDGDYQVWNFAFVKKDLKLLKYRLGNYRKSHLGDGERNNTIGFISPLSQLDRSLFDTKFHGTLGASITNVLVDLDLHHTRYLAEIEARSRFLGAAIVESEESQAILAVCEIRLPTGCPVMTRKLSMNDLAWVDQSSLRRDSNDLEPWSESVVRHFV